MPTTMKFVGGTLCLDFINTVGGWSAGRVLDDKLECYADLLRWARLAGAIPASAPRPDPPQAAQVLARARVLRRALHRLFNCVLDSRRPSPADLNVLRAELATARKHQTLTLARGKFRWEWDDAPSPDSVLWRVSQSAADLVTSPDLERLRRCAGENCGWLFMDSTRNHTRQWCDMKDCGNLAKVRRYRERHTRAKS